MFSIYTAFDGSTFGQCLTTDRVLLLIGSNARLYPQIERMLFLTFLFVANRRQPWCDYHHERSSKCGTSKEAARFSGNGVTSS